MDIFARFGLTASSGDTWKIAADYLDETGDQDRNSAAFRAEIFTLSLYSSDGSGDGSGDGDGYSSGHSSGYGSGHGSGDGYGDGSGDGSGDGYGYGYGYG